MRKLRKTGAGIDVTGLPEGVSPADVGMTITPPGGSPGSGDTDGEAGLSAEEAQKLGEKLKIRLKAVDIGIGIGVTKDLALTHGGIVDTISGKVQQGLSAIFYPGAGLEGDSLLSPFSGLPRELERRVRNESTLMLNNTKINNNTISGFQKHVINPSRNLYNKNFSDFIKLIRENRRFKNIEPNNTSIDSLAIEYKSADVSMRTTSEESPYRIVLKKLIPLLREKFNAVFSFREKVGEGSTIDFDGVSERFANKAETADDVEQIEGLYKAIQEWRIFIEGLSLSGSIIDTDEKEEKKKVTDDEGKPVELISVLKGIHINAVRSGNLVGANPSGDGLLIDRGRLTPTDVPVVKLFLGGGMVKYVNSVGTAKDYFNYFLDKGHIIITAPGVRKVSAYILRLSTETVNEGAELSIYFKPMAIHAAIGAGSDKASIMVVKTKRGNLSIEANDKALLDDLIKLSTATSTTPLYETVSPSGERVVFTSTDLVLNEGRLKDSKGNKFKYKNRKGKSLADRVMSKDFGKVRRGLKKKKR